jgi:uncharacterized protein
MNNRLPLYSKASVAIERGLKVSGVVNIADLPELAGLLSRTDGVISVALKAEKHLDGSRFLHGHLQAELFLECQRCMQPMPWLLDDTFELRLVFSEEEELRWLKDSDPYLVQDDRLPFWQIVEAESLLMLPMIARCEVVNCPNSADVSALSTNEGRFSDNSGLPADEPRTENAALAVLKNLKF